MRNLKDYIITEVSTNLIDNAYTKAKGGQRGRIKKYAKDLYNYNPQKKITSKKELQNILEQRLAEDKNANLNDIDVSLITDMSDLFSVLSHGPHNIDISEWNVSNVKDMSSMFDGCENFNSDLSKWDVSNVENTHHMFYDCYNFNSDLSKWDVSNVKDMSGMFEHCVKFNCDLSKWNVSKVEDIDYMFSGCKKFNCKKLEDWNLSKKLMYSYGGMFWTFNDCPGKKPSWYNG